MLAYLLSLRKVRLGLLLATWFLCRQSYIDLSMATIGRRTCYLMTRTLMLAGLEPMANFCLVSSIWTSTIVGLTTVAYIFNSIRVYLREEFKSFWIELEK
ncbi:hypothetical protein PSTT_10113 [Puccinia striiformis]|uniref:Uncharacterized protein n=1 Tax=Puccinia striiformis TaxID=27350 RepID=A0A2S4V5T3_9BASI|nr:hypothetical protein PSTT_10113 [Puccinia striiformis]